MNNFQKFSFSLALDILETAVWFNGQIFIFKREKINQLMALLRTKLYRPTTEIEEIIYSDTQMKLR